MLIGVIEGYESWLSAHQLVALSHNKIGLDISYRTALRVLQDLEDIGIVESQMQKLYHHTSRKVSQSLFFKWVGWPTKII
jgi:DNA-binding transcriptional regulator YhcF (GntR family)